MREKWGSRFGFVMATTGFAVGLGNIWRFPYMVGQSGGGAFLLVYVAFALLIGIPLLTAEISLGRKAQLTPIAGMRRLTRKAASPWNLVGWLSVGAGVLIMSYYLMILAWVVAYFVKMARGELAGITPEIAQETYSSFIAKPLPVVAYTLFVVLLLAAMVGRGLRKGVERVSSFAMPLLLILIVALVLRSLTFPGAGEGLLWYLTPDFSRLTGEVVLAALGHAFLSIGIGMAVAFGFGSYLAPKASDVPGDAAIVVAADTFVAFLAGLMIFPALFAFGVEPNSGPGLVFMTLPTLCNLMPLGQVFGSLFFFLLTIAGLTSAVALFEILTASLTDSLGIARRKAVWIVALVLFLLSIPVILSQGPWARVRVRGMDIFALVDTVSTNYLLPVGALLLSLYTAFVWGFERFRQETNAGSGRFRVFAWWKLPIRLLIPAAVAVILLAGLGVFG
jgi:NSS family neurotransmitter:Na+ symporter